MIQQFDSYLIENDGYNPRNEPFVYRCRGCNNNLTSNDPASQYQRQKIIQNTVRVQSSLFTMNLAALSAYERPNLTYKVVDVSGNSYIVSPGVNWNQMSDRKEPHIQVVNTGAGSGYHSSSTKRTITSSRPGAMSPGGVGVDIKHNSYDRYLNRLKGKAPVRRGVIPANFGTPYIPFNRADPIYGGKVQNKIKYLMSNINSTWAIMSGLEKWVMLVENCIRQPLQLLQMVYSQSNLQTELLKLLVENIFQSTMTAMDVFLRNQHPNFNYIHWIQKKEIPLAVYCRRYQMVN